MTDSRLRALLAFWRELRRRRVVRVALAYGAIGFGVMQVADTFFPALRLPDWSITLVAVLVILGFPVAMVLAWAFEVTPEGVRRTDAGLRGTGAGRRGRVAFMAVLILLPVVGLAAYVGVRSRGPGPVGAAEVSPSMIAVLPFRYSGGSGHAYLAEGVVDLLSTKVDGVGSLGSVDPNALFGILAQESDSAWASPVGAGAVARRLGAGQYVLGSITQVGTGLQIRATLYDAGGDATASAEVVAESDEDLLSAVDEAARQLLAAQLGDGHEMVQLAALTTRSMPALRAYLEGEQLLRKADGAGAEEAFERAVGVDSLFALAYWSLAVAREWGGAGAPGEAAARALALRDQLPRQPRALLDAYYRYLVGDHAAAESAYRAILARTPNDVTANYGLAEVLFHYAAAAGRLPREAQPLFRQVIRFQPDHAPSLYHLTTLAALENDRAALDSTTERFATIGSPYTSDLRAQQVFAVGDRAGVDSLVAELARPGGRFVNYGFWAGTARDLEDLRRLARAIAASDHPEPERTRARRWGAYLDFALGRLSVARDASSLDDPLDLAQRAYLAAFPFAPTDPAEARTLADALLRLSPGDLDYLAEGGLVPGTAIRDFLLGMLSARMGDEAQARAHAASLDTLTLPPAAGTHATDLRMEILALADHMAGRHERALATIEAMPLQPGLGDFAFVPWLGLGTARLLRGQLLAEAGRHEEAVRWLEAVRVGSYVGTLLRAPAHLALARTHDRAGDAETAARHYAGFIELWEHADPELQPQVEAARRRLSQLVEAGRGP